MQNVSRQRDLITAVKRADLHKITSLLEKGVDPNFHVDGGSQFCLNTHLKAHSLFYYNI